jgi:hypothetical protein
MTEIVKDRLYYRRFGTNEEGWVVCLSSPESGFLQQFAFELPPDEELKKMDRVELGELLAHHAAVGAAFGFRHGLTVGALSDIAQVDPDSAWLKDEALKTSAARRAEVHAKRRAEEDTPGSEWPPVRFIEWWKNSFAFKKKP